MNEFYRDDSLILLQGDAGEQLASLQDSSVDCCVTSPPYYGLRDYGVEGQLGVESTPDEYVTRLIGVFREVWRVLADDGTLFLNIGDSYAYPPGSGGLQGNGQRKGRSFTAEGLAGTRALPPKNLLGIPWRVAFALQADGWILRNAIVSHKTNPMPESVKDRVSSTYEHVFLLTKSPKYWFDIDPIRSSYSPNKPWGANKSNKAGQATASLRGHRADQHQAGLLGSRVENPLGRNPGDVWSIPTQPYPGAHYAPMPVQLARFCVLAGCQPGGTVLDPFCGTGTSLLAANQTGRRGVGIDLNPDYLKLAMQRCQQAPLALDDGGAA